jgi:hypothetical protein
MDQTIFTSLKVEDLIGLIADRIMSLLLLKTQEKTNEPQPEDLLSIEDIQKIFNVSKVTVHKWKKKGLIPFYKMNRKVYFKKSEVINSMNHKKRKMEV